LTGVNLELVDRAAESVAVHAQLARGAALVALVFLEHGEDEAFLELTHTLCIKDVAFVHLQDECF
jgi:hypothetical protein